MTLDLYFPALGTAATPVAEGVWDFEEANTRSEAGDGAHNQGIRDEYPKYVSSSILRAEPIVSQPLFEQDTISDMPNGTDAIFQCREGPEWPTAVVSETEWPVLRFGVAGLSIQDLSFAFIFLVAYRKGLAGDKARLEFSGSWSMFSQGGVVQFRIDSWSYGCFQQKLTARIHLNPLGFLSQFSNGLANELGRAHVNARMMCEDRWTRINMRCQCSLTRHDVNWMRWIHHTSGEACGEYGRPILIQTKECTREYIIRTEPELTSNVESQPTRMGEDGVPGGTSMREKHMSA
ncbi:hypothetical protein IW261DRAFT_1422016 [Armillaria novae-zelandiae]|uniref:Uncharacterized protein n=1 Tax=Armillaria novae-zelandiae TaxID=153914 RepID=A0AA39UAZ2_9AGAR|nr:hypothetical protein IW261DRAFT_1422016 [Armillaria novae-zelandiae]